MDTFDEWVKTATQYPCIQDWGEKAVALGASWDSFRRQKQEITRDLVDGGIPILAARDIVDIASSEVKRSTAPMAIFWDLENMPIPANVSGRDITSSLKNILAPHGDLIQFRGYASIGLNLIPQEKRSDLQLSGCHLVDCPHHGRKEVADKMIIVDAMQFAYQHSDGATLCFITGDVDYAYLLAVLQRRPEWRTIVISRGTMQSMLHVNCHMKMRWETDILQSIYSSSLVAEGEGLEETNEDTATDKDHDHTMNRFVPLTADEFWKDDVELLRNVIIQEGRRFATKTPRKSQVGNVLRQTNPARFPNRDSIKAFLAQAIERGVVTETGSGAFKELALTGRPQDGSGWLTLSEKAPLTSDSLPEKALELASTSLPFILFIRKLNCPSGFSPPAKAFVQSTEEWLLLMFASHSDVVRSVTDHPWLRKGTVVDWREIATSKPVYGICGICGANYSRRNKAMEYLLDDGKPVCSLECKRWSAIEQAAKQQAVQFTIETLQFMAENDELYVKENNLYRILQLRHPDVCLNRKYGRLWVAEAICSGDVVTWRRPESRSTVVSLQEHYDTARLRFPPENLDTLAEEQFVNDLLCELSDSSGMDRREVAQRLEAAFDRMGNPHLRNKVLLNGQAHGKIYLCKGPFLHIVGLTKEQAKSALETETHKLHHPGDNTEPNGFDKEVSSDAKSDASLSHTESEASSDPDFEMMLPKNDSEKDSLPFDNVVVLNQSTSTAAGRSVASADPSNASILSESQSRTTLNIKIDDNGNFASRNLHVSGYGQGTTKQELYKKFSRFAKIKEVCHKGWYMFVNTASKEDAIEARRQLCGQELNGGRLKINFAK